MERYMTASSLQQTAATTISLSYRFHIYQFLSHTVHRHATKFHSMYIC